MGKKLIKGLLMMALVVVTTLCVGMSSKAANAPEVWWEEDDIGATRTRYNMVGNFYEYTQLKFNGVVIAADWSGLQIYDDPRSTYGSAKYESIINQTGTYTYQMALCTTQDLSTAVWSNETSITYNFSNPKIQPPVVLSWDDNNDVTIIPNANAKWYSYEIYRNGNCVLSGSYGVDVADDYYFCCRKGSNGTILLNISVDLAANSTYEIRTFARAKDVKKFLNSDTTSFVKVTTNKIEHTYNLPRDMKWNTKKPGEFSFYSSNVSGMTHIKMFHIESGLSWDFGNYGFDDPNKKYVRDYSYYMALPGHYQIVMSVGEDTFNDYDITAATPGVAVSDLYNYAPKKKQLSKVTNVKFENDIVTFTFGKDIKKNLPKKYNVVFTTYCTDGSILTDNLAYTCGVMNFDSATKDAVLPLPGYINVLLDKAKEKTISKITMSVMAVSDWHTYLGSNPVTIVVYPESAKLAAANISVEDLAANMNKFTSADFINQLNQSGGVVLNAGKYTTAVALPDGAGNFVASPGVVAGTTGIVVLEGVMEDNTVEYTCGTVNPANGLLLGFFTKSPVNINVYDVN